MSKFKIGDIVYCNGAGQYTGSMFIYEIVNIVDTYYKMKFLYSNSNEQTFPTQSTLPYSISEVDVVCKLCASKTYSILYKES